MKTLVESLYQKVREDIVECELTPGTAFSEAELGRRYKASRTPVREACRRLEHEGLICITPFRGYAIAPLSVAEFHNLQELQISLEPLAAALAAERAKPAELDEMESLAIYKYRAGDRVSQRLFIQSNYQLHTLIARSSRNRLLGDIVGNLHVRLMRFFFLGLAHDECGPSLVSEHLQIVEAIRSRDPELARQKTAEHIHNVISRSSALLTSAIRFGEAVFEPAPQARFEHEYRPAPSAAAGK